MNLCYIKAVECRNAGANYICLQCGLCGRIFDEKGFMTSGGGTHAEGYEEDE